MKKSCPNSIKTAITGTKRIQWILSFEIVLFQTANKTEMYENSQRPSGKEYKNQAGKFSAKGSVNKR